ncbi:hypothetical protein LJC55_04405 [Eubacteriales bacterium OttesenSCG-928-N14]|nr:hypothetical protein [Eubacteriales bacterium OttesenSCG-928-N14]
MNSYRVYDHGCELEPGTRIVLERSLYLNSEGFDISELIEKPLDEVKDELSSSEELEQAFFENMKIMLKEWDGFAEHTQILSRAIEYLEIPPVEHTMNKWIEDDYGHHNRSNMVYEFYYRVYEDTRYDRDTQTQIVNAWYLSWAFTTNSYRIHNAAKSHTKIAGQHNKRFSDKAAMEKYLEGRIKKYEHFFEKISPPMPLELAGHFTVNGRILPGYTIMGENEKQIHGIDEKPIKSKKDYER